MTPDANRTMSSVTPSFPWHALRVRSNYERTTAMHLRQRGYEDFAPQYKVERNWSDRKKTTEVSLFPGYVFARFNYNERLPVLTTPGVVGIVSFGKDPCPVAEEEIESVRLMVNSGLLVSPFPYLKEGQRVIVERGPLAGVKGILKEIKGGYRVVVSISLLSRSIATELDTGWIRPLSPSQSRSRYTNGVWVSTDELVSAGQQTDTVGRLG